MERLTHDLGGRTGFGPIDRTEHETLPWEWRAIGLLQSISGRGKRIIRTDELRRAIESLEPDQYRGLGYYERWVAAIERLLVEKGVLTSEEIDGRMGQADGVG